MSCAVNKFVNLGYIAEAKDAKLPRRINITDEDVKNAAPGNPCECAAACALRRETPDATHAFVYKSAVYVCTEDPVTGLRCTLRYMPGKELREMIVQLDTGGKFVPGRYDCLPPKNSQTLKAVKKREKRKERHKEGDKTIKRGPRMQGRLQWSMDMNP